MFRAGFSNVSVTIEQIIGEEDLIAFRFVLQGTHSGSFAGYLPTGKEVTLTGVDFMRIVGGKITEMWSVQDTLSWSQQLGSKISH